MTSTSGKVTGNLGNEGTNEKNLSTNPKYKYLASAYIVGLSGATAIIAGVFTFYRTKKKQHEYFKDLNKEPQVVAKAPVSLAFKALGWATLLSVGFCSVAVLGICAWFNIKNLEDLRTVVRKHTKRPGHVEGRTEFKNLSEFLLYLEETYKSNPKKT